MKAWKALLLAAPLLLPAVTAAAETSVTRCYGTHFVRVNGGELRFTVFAFNNGDLANGAVIQRLTFFDANGNVLHDSGPKVGVPHPLNRAVNPPRDITMVPPGAIYAFSTTDIWGVNPIPEAPGTDLLSVRVEVAKAENPALLVVHGREQARDRVLLPNGFFTIGAERSANLATCFLVKN